MKPVPELTPEQGRRFARSLRKRGDCIVWTGETRAKDGYGRFAIHDGGRRVRYSAHRIAYAAVFGDPGHLHLDHTCRNKACCNPFHLEPVCLAENNRRRDLATGAVPGTVCKRGHVEDYVSRADGSRYCRSCHNERRRVSPGS